MSIKVVKKTEIEKIKGRPKHLETYDGWFKQALTLKPDEALEITLSKSNPSLPSPRAATLAVQRWNRSNPTQGIRCVLKDSRSDKPILYLFSQKEGEELLRKQSGRASS
jgi:hypothetical protein